MLVPSAVASGFEAQSHSIGYAADPDTLQEKQNG